MLEVRTATAGGVYLRGVYLRGVYLRGAHGDGASAAPRLLSYLSAAALIC